MQEISRVLLTFLINALWQVPLVSLAAALGARVLRNAPARYRHALWVMALGLAVLLPAFSVRVLNQARIPVPREVSTAEGAKPVPSMLAAPSNSGSSAGKSFLAGDAFTTIASGSRVGGLFECRIRAITFSPVVAGVILTLFFLSMILHLLRLWRAWDETALVRATAFEDVQFARISPLARRCATAIGAKGARVLFSRRVRGPVSQGARRPAIILPFDFPVSPEELTSALCHEMAHIRRHDFLKNIVYEFASMPIAFHPAARFIKRRIEQTRELACDEMASGSMVAAPVYARSLVSMARAISALSNNARPGYNLGVFDANILAERVMRLLDNRSRLSARSAAVALLAGLFILAGTCLGASTWSLSAANETSAESHNPLAPFIGRWRGGVPGKSVLTLRLTMEGEKLTGEIKSLPVPPTRSGGEAQPSSSGTTWRISGGQVDNKKLTLQGENDEGNSSEFELLLTGDRNALFHIVGPPPPPDDPNSKGLEMTKESEGSNGESLDLFFGTWEAKFEGAKYIVVSLRKGKQGLEGAVSLGNFGVDDDGQVNNVHVEPDPAHSQPILTAQVQGETLQLTTRLASGRDNTFQMKVFSSDQAVIKWNPVNLPEGAPVPGWWTITRVDAVESNSERPMQRGPSGSVSGKVTGGLGDGVAGGVVGGVPGETQSGADRAGGTISGTVSDPSGARVPAAFVSAINSREQVIKVVVSDDAGEFSITGLPSDHYILEVNKPGFVVSRTHLALDPSGRNAVQADINTVPARVLQSVEVTAKGPEHPAENPSQGRPHRIRVGGLVQAPSLITQTKPFYPPDAKAKGIQGVVILEAVISTEGFPLSIKVVDSPDPELSQAAMDAVKQWRYDPTLLNGEPIEVVTDIAVRFRLEH